VAQLSDFARPDTAPDYLIDFLDFLDNQPGIQSLRAAVAKRLRLSAGQRVLDLGCGIGGATFPLAEITGSAGLAAGVDINAPLLEVASRRAAGRSELQFRIGDACAIPYPDGFFDAAQTERVFLYLPDRAAALHEIKRVVKPGGRLCLVDTDLDSTAIYSSQTAQTRKMTSIFAGSVPNANSGRELPTLARQAGLTDIEIDTYAFASPYEFLLRSMSGALYNAAEKGIVSRGEVDEWLSEQASLNANGDFFQVWIFVVVAGTVVK
jgi:ubiquinone/menaquinone biosynthesis C-methylase UbiE